MEKISTESICILLSASKWFIFTWTIKHPVYFESNTKAHSQQQIWFCELTSIPVIEKQRQATFPRCPCNTTTSFSSWSFHTLTVRSQEPVACGEPKERRGDAAHAERLKTNHTARRWFIPHTASLMRRRCFGQLQCDPATPRPSHHTETPKHYCKTESKNICYYMKRVQDVFCL